VTNSDRARAFPLAWERNECDAFLFFLKWGLIKASSRRFFSSCFWRRSSLKAKFLCGHVSLFSHADGTSRSSWRLFPFRGARIAGGLLFPPLFLARFKGLYYDPLRLRFIRNRFSPPPWARCTPHLSLSSKSLPFFSPPPLPPTPGRSLYRILPDFVAVMGAMIFLLFKGEKPDPFCGCRGFIPPLFFPSPFSKLSSSPRPH